MDKCKIKNCNERTYARNLCRYHYRTWSKYGNPTFFNHTQKTLYNGGEFIGEKRKKLDQHDIEWVSKDSKCNHEWYKKIYKVLFYAGGYMNKMKKCKKCKKFISADMENHTNGRHYFEILIKDGFLQCTECNLAIHPDPIMNFSGRIT